MDVTLQQIEQQVFSEKFRGYDPDQVDEFLEQVGATLARLRDELKVQTERAQRAETAAAQLRERAEQAAPEPSPAATEGDEIAQATSTLALAKRTADAALAEARADAERIVRDATTERDALLHRAQEDAKAEFEAKVGDYRALLADLDATKERLGRDVERLEARIAEYRTVLTDVHASVGSLLEDPDGLQTRPPLDVDLTPTEPPASPFYSTAATPVVDAGPPTEAIQPDEVTGGDPWGPGSWSEVSAALDDEPFQPEDGSVEAVATEPAGGDAPPEQDDRYLQELHDAVNAEEAASGDPAMEEFFDEDEPRPRRFSRRR